MTLVLSFYRYDGMIGAAILPDAETALKIKAAVESLGSEYKANMHALGEVSGDHVDQATIDKVNAWLTQNDYPPVTADSLKPR